MFTTPTRKLTRRCTISGAKIVLATLAQMSNSELKRAEFHLTINDEGGETLEMSLLQALRPSTHTPLVVGDERQLRGSTYLPERIHFNFPDDCAHTR